MTRPILLGSLSTLLVAGVSGKAVAQDSAAAPKGPPTAIVVSGPEPGRKAPDFTAPWADKNGIGPADGDFSLEALKGQVVVLAFYPQDFTSGCTAEMRTFADQYATLIGDAVLVGISIDSLDTHVRFAESLGLPFRLLSDPHQRIAAKYGAKGSDGFNRRVVYVIGKNGKVTWREMRFGATDPNAYSRLQAAIADARGAS